MRSTMSRGRSPGVAVVDEPLLVAEYCAVKAAPSNLVVDSGNGDPVGIGVNVVVIDDGLETARQALTGRSGSRGDATFT